MNKMEQNIVNNTIFVTIPLSENIDNFEVNFFSFRAVFFNKNNTIVKKTDTIVCYKNLYLPYLADNLSFSINEKPYLEDTYFANPSSNSDPFTSSSFLNITTPTNGKYAYEDFRRLKHIFHADFACFVLFVLQNFRKIGIEALKMKADLLFDSLLVNISYLYDISTKTFLYINVDLDFTGNIARIAKCSAKINIYMEGYKIIGCFTKKSKGDILLYDKERKLLGNFLSLVPINKESHYSVNVDVNIANLFKIAINHVFWVNNAGFVGLASDVYGSGVNSGFWIPCYNLNGKLFTELYCEKILNNQTDYFYDDVSQAEQIEQTLSVNINPVQIDSDFINKKFYIKKIYQELKGDVNTYIFDNLDDKIIFLNIIQDPQNSNWEKIKIDGKDFEWYQYMSRLNFEFDFNTGKTTIAFNHCFEYNHGPLLFLDSSHFV
jgi:hypothetical protein